MEAGRGLGPGLEAGTLNRQEESWVQRIVGKDDAFLIWIRPCTLGRQKTIRNFRYPDRCEKSGLLRVISLSPLKKQYHPAGVTQWLSVNL